MSFPYSAPSNLSHPLARAAICLAIVSALIGSTAPSPLFAVYKQHWGLTAMVQTALYAVYALGVVTSLLAVGAFADRIRDRRQVLLAGLAIVIAGSLLMAFAQQVPQLFAGRLLAGVGTGALMGSCNAALIDLDTGRKRPLAALLGTLSITGGAALGPIITSAAMATDLAPLALPFVFNAVLAGVAALCVVRLPAAVPPPLSALAEADETPSWGDALSPVALPFALSCVILVLAWSSGSIFMALGPTIMRTLDAPDNAARAGLVVSLFQVTAGCTQMATYRLDRRRAVQLGCLLLALGWLGCVVAWHLDALTAFLAGAVLSGVGYGAAFTGASGKVNEIAPASHRAFLSSAFLVSGYGGSTLVVLMMGKLTDMFDLETAMSMFGCLAVKTTLYVFLQLRSIPRLPARGAMEPGR
ncbi:MFS transporter [Variovorax sp. J31P207]|uniref:MFS transporter n=1 Tax=Variovorax sp. J31P207 TaxID=3053510 RepID=UPI002575B7B7|nr:MFS transporter [Variovorax sp. J31P207]MDM0071521.1 MFS transporter [Variovorax sp. J31P207]